MHELVTCQQNCVEVLMFAADLARTPFWSSICSVIVSRPSRNGRC